ncbi:hypothetical protein EH222_05035, partial [candidate division KSB1 bacterium]
MRGKNLFQFAIVLVTLLTMAFGLNGQAYAQSVVSSATPSDTSPAIDEQITVAVNINMTGASGKLLGSYSASLAWNAAIFEYVSYAGGAAPFNTPTVNTSNTASGRITFSAAAPSGASGNINILTVTLRAKASGTSTFDLNYTAMAAAMTFENLLPYLTINDGSATVGNPNTAPYATNVSISGTTQVGQVLTGSYTYNDNDGDAEGTSTFRWLRNDAAIAGATSKTYTLVAADQGAMIKFEVTPVA